MSNIVLIESVTIVRFAIKNVLIQEGYNVFDFGQARGWLESPLVYDRIDLIIVSTNHETEAVEFVNECKKAMQLAPIVFLIRDIRKEVVSWLAAQGAADFIIKPVIYEKLADRIKKRLPSQTISFQLEDLIQLEMARAQRGKYHFSLLYIELEEEPGSDVRLMARNMEKLKDDCTRLFRNVDLLVLSGNMLVVLLPFTPKNGMQVVIDKVTRLVQTNVARYPFQLKVGGAAFPEECNDVQELTDLARSRMHTNLYTKQMLGKIREQALQKQKPAAMMSPYAPAGDRNQIFIEASVTEGSIQLKWNNVIESKYFEVKRYSGSVLDFSKRVFVNRYMDYYTKGGMSYTYQVTGLSRYSGEKVESSIQIRTQTY